MQAACKITYLRFQMRHWW